MRVEETGRWQVPRISEFFGIAIYMYFNYHSPPHFHAEYGEFEALYAIDTIEVLRGSLPRRAHSMVVEWTTIHRLEIKGTGIELATVAPC